MGVMNLISGAKAKFHQTKMDIIEHRTDKIRAENLRQAEITQKKQELREAQQIREDLRRDQMQQVEKAGPTGLQKFGKGLSRAVNQSKKMGGAFGGTKLGAPASNVGPGIQQSVRDVFGAKPMEKKSQKSSSPFSFGPTPKQMPKKERRKQVIINL